MLRRRFLNQGSEKPNVIITYYADTEVPFAAGLTKKLYIVTTDFTNAVDIGYLISESYNNGVGKWELFIKSDILHMSYISPGNIIPDTLVLYYLNGYLINNDVTYYKNITRIDIESEFTTISGPILASMDGDGDQLEHISLPNNLEILNATFDGFNKLERLNIPESVKELSAASPILRIPIDSNNYNANFKELWMFPSNPPNTRYFGCIYMETLTPTKETHPNFKIRILPNSIISYLQHEKWNMYAEFFKVMPNIQYRTENNEPIEGFPDINDDDKTVKCIKNISFNDSANTFVAIYDDDFTVLNFKYGVGSVKEMILSPGVIIIPKYVLGYFHDIKYISIPTTVKYFGQQNFSKANEVIVYWNPICCLSIDSYRYGYLSGISQFVIGDKVEYLFDYLLSDIDFNIFEIPNNVLGIARNCFKNALLYKPTFANSSILNELAANYWGAIMYDKEVSNNDKDIYCFNENELVYIKNRYDEPISRYLIIPDTAETINLRQSISVDTMVIPNSVSNIKSLGSSFIKNLILECDITEINIPFNNCEDINIPNSVTYISSQGIDTLGKLWQKYNKNGIVYINNCLIGASSDVSGEIIIEEGTRLIASNAFCYNKNITKVTMPNTVTHINNRAFSACTNLKEITLSNSLVDIGSNAFYGTAITNIYIPTTVKSIGSQAFYSCTNLENITIPEGITYIGENAFSGTAYSNNDDNWFNGNSLYVGNCLLKTKHNNVDISFMYGISLIASGCVNNSSQKSLVIPDSVKYIGENSFKNLYYITELIIPKNVISIGQGSFTDNYFTSISVHEDNQIYDSRDNCNMIIETATNTIIATSENSIIPEGIVNIRKDAFNRASLCNSIRNLTIPKTLINIEQISLTNNVDYQRIESIIVDENNPVYDSRNNCNAIIETKLDKVLFGINIIPDNIAIIGQSAFTYRTFIEVVLPNTLLEVQTNAFYMCNIKKLIINKYINYIANNAFYGNIESVYYNGSIELWSIINKSSNLFKSGTIIHCTDGDITYT